MPIREGAGPSGPAARRPARRGLVALADLRKDACVTTRSRPLVLLVALACGSFACKDDGPADLDSGLPEEKVGTELTPTEQTQLCEARADYAASLVSPAEAKSMACTLEGIFFAAFNGGDQKACETVRDGCLQKPDKPASGTCDLGVDWTTCAATVAELEDCYQENADASLELTRSLSCAKIEEYKASPPDTSPAAGPACSAAEARCPTVLGTMDVP